MPTNMCDKHWFKDTSRLSVPVYFSWQLFLPPCIMAEDWQMDTEDASSQVFQAFRSLAPFLDGSLKLTPNPGALKRQKVRPDSKDLKDDKSNVDSGLTPALQVMAKMLIHLDRDQQMQKREDTYIFFFNSAEETGSLHLLRKTAEQWHNQSTQGSSSLRTPLRQLLLQKLFQDLMDRIQKLLDAPEGSELMQKAMDAMILLPDRTFPYLEWNPIKKALQVSKKTPLSLNKMHQNCTEMLDMLSDPSIIQRFHALPVKENSNVAPWRLQVSLRADRPWELLQALASSSVWTLMATSLKPHSRMQSPLALQLEQMMSLTTGKDHKKGKGKGKSHRPSPQTTKKERNTP